MEVPDCSVSRNLLLSFDGSSTANTGDGEDRNNVRNG
jgi:hypothetical protein